MEQRGKNIHFYFFLFCNMKVLTNLTLIFFLRQMNLKSSYLQFSKEKYALDGATSLQNERKNRNAETEERKKKERRYM